MVRDQAGGALSQVIFNRLIYVGPIGSGGSSLLRVSQGVCSGLNPAIFLLYHVARSTTHKCHQQTETSALEIESSVRSLHNPRGVEYHTPNFIIRNSSYLSI